MRSQQGSWLVVTPALNEETRLPNLARSLAAQTLRVVGLWVIVDDGSTDATATCVDPATTPFPTLVHRRVNSGGLVSASELAAFRAGVGVGLEVFPDATFIMKLDADIVLDPDYFRSLGDVQSSTGMIGGILEDRDEVAQASHVRGGLRAYSRQGWEVASDLPAALAWDILDQVAVRHAGMEVVVSPAARATTSRTTGSSVGRLQGRRRLGTASRWAGYDPVYLAAKVARYAVRPPYVGGAIALLWGYLTAGRGPFAESLRAENKAEQRRRLVALLRHPVTRGRGLYSR